MPGACSWISLNRRNKKGGASKVNPKGRGQDHKSLGALGRSVSVLRAYG